MPSRLISIQYLMRLVFVAAVILTALTAGDMSVVYGTLAAALMARWIVAPIVQHATHWVDAALPYEPFELDDPDVPLVLVELLQHTEPALRSLGFELRGRFRRAGAGPARVTGYITLFEHPTTFEQSRVIASVAPTKASLTLVFRTEYKDGTQFATSNGKFPRVLPFARSRPGSMAFPQVRGVRLLHAIHGLRAESEGRVEVGIDHPIERLVRNARLEHSAWLDAGYYRPEPGSTRMRLTWKGAILMSWKLLWPVPQIRLEWRRWQAARFLRGIGIGEAAWIAVISLTLAALASGPLGLAVAQPPVVRSGEVVPREVRQIYDRGLEFLAATQSPDGTWDAGTPGPAMRQGLENAAQADGSWASAGKQGPGVTALALLAFLASGEDANFGIFSSHIRKALRSLLVTQDANTGYIGPSMYHHGFAMLALAEAYGAVDERTLWSDETAPRSVGEALELAVRTAITAQKSNPTHAWRYSPDGRDADASVSGAVIIGLLAARNAGIEVPDESIDKAIAYFRSMTDRSGDVFYLNQGNRLSTSTARVSIATLTYAVARRKDLAEFKATLNYLKQRIGEPSGPFGEYTLYYEAQALFQGDVASWEKWNKILVRQLREAQQPDGSIRGRFNPVISTSLSLLSLALNYRFLPIYER